MSLSASQETAKNAFDKVMSPQLLSLHNYSRDGSRERALGTEAFPPLPDFT